MMDSLNRDQKAVVITLFIIFVLSGIMYLISPLMINAYFNHVEVYTVREAQDYIASENKYGKTIVVRGEVIPDTEGGFLIKDNNSEILMFISTKLNCIPSIQGKYRVAGAWNQGRSTPIFYAVWIIGGCNDLIDNRPSSEKEADILN